jgi:Calpain family cysteine protease
MLSSFVVVGCHTACLLCEKSNRRGESLTCIHVDSDDNDIRRHRLDSVARLLTCQVVVNACHGERLYFAKSSKSGETWVPLVEKACAKLHGAYASD